VGYSVVEVTRLTPEHLDVLVVGAGISGICAGYHLQQRLQALGYVE